MNQQPYTVVIAGGGSAGWMSAAFLSAVFSTQYKIILVESEEVPTIGVGEATVHTMRGFLNACGVEEGRFLKEASATLKHGILFKDWALNPAIAPKLNQYFHSFESYPQIANEQMAGHWLNATKAGRTTDRYDRWSGLQSVLAAANKSPKAFNDGSFESLLPYGYHLDANQFAYVLKEVALERKVEHLVRHIETVNLDENGSIESLSLKGSEPLRGDFFIDCTGFSSLLIKAVGSKFINCDEHLAVDNAVTFQAPLPSEQHKARPYTTATARESGWTFEIDLQGRRGIGLIYSGAHASKSEAEAQLRSYYPEVSANVSANHLPMRTGRMDKSWNRNCLAVGLSGGFVEPMESTGLYFIEIGLRLFVDYFHKGKQNRPPTDRFNVTFNKMFDHAIGFLYLHYHLSKRDDTEFWRHVRHDMKPVEFIHDLLELWEYKIPTDTDLLSGLIFQAPNFAAILYGMGWQPKHRLAAFEHISPEDSLAVYRRLEQFQKNAVTSLPSHADFLQKTVATFA